MQDTTFNIDKVIDKGMLPVIRKRDIVRARVLTREEKKEIQRGGPDVLAITPSGQRIMLNRAEIISKYTYLDGKKISIAGWASTKEYIVARLDDTQALAMMIPIGSSLEINGSKANDSKRKKGDYVVCLLDKSGVADVNTAGILTSAMFKKMYYMPPNEVITRNYGKKQAKDNTKPRSKVVNKPIDFKKELEHPKFDFGDNDMESIPITKESMQASLPRTSIHFKKEQTETQSQSIKSPEQQRTDYKYIAIGRLTSMSGETVGFVIQSKSGQTKQITKEQMLDACKKRLVSNVMVGVKSDTGNSYLRGNNIRLESLPAYPTN